MNRLEQHPAVVDGTLSAGAAFCGMREDELAMLARKHPTAEVLIRFGRGRTVERAINAPSIIRHEEEAGDYVRDVTLRPHVEEARAATLYLPEEHAGYDADPGL